MMANETKRIGYVCARCGSSNVTSDSIARWDARNQVWVVVGHYDSSECLDCQHDELLEVELAPAA